MKHFIFHIAILFLLVFSLTGCGEKETENRVNEFTVYYPDCREHVLMTTQYQALSIDTESIAREISEQFVTEYRSLEGNIQITGNNVIEELSLDGRILSVALEETYSALDSIDELLFRASYVLTLTQIPDVAAVYFSLGGEPLRDAEGKVFGNMTASSFTSYTGENSLAYTKETVTCYFADESGTMLIPYTEEIRLSNNMSKEQYIVNKLASGPNQEGFFPVMDSSVRVLSVSTKENICYVNFDEKFLEGLLAVNPAVTLYAIVNSLTELPHVNYVQISINGETTYEFAGEDLSGRLKHNLDYVKEDE